MLIVRCDYHPGFQQTAFLDTATRELTERRLAHRDEAKRIYRDLQQRSLAAQWAWSQRGLS